MAKIEIEIDLLSTSRGTVTAPAGCGKTELITRTLKNHQSTKPILVLTHTNAGVGALQSRLRRAQVGAEKYRIATIDGWAMNLISKFPARSGHDPEILKLKNKSTDYNNIRNAAYALIKNGHIKEPLQATYSRLLVDEYQDCSKIQHAIVDWTAEILPTCVLGDPMQAIFGFKGNTLVDWQKNVLAQFPSVGELQTPWRWKNANTEDLGRWLLNARTVLTAGQPLDLRTAPNEVTWVQVTVADAIRRLQAANEIAPTWGENVLIIGDSRNPNEQKMIASQTPGATAVENVELADLSAFGATFDLQSPTALDDLVKFAGNLMTHTNGAELIKRVATIKSGRALKTPSKTEAMAVAFTNEPSYFSAAIVLREISMQPEVRKYRPDVLNSCLNALDLAATSGYTLQESIEKTREQSRYSPRIISRKAVGSTLLLKGLEADIVIILKPELMKANDLYVALTRGAKRVIICSPTASINPSTF